MPPPHKIADTSRKPIAEGSTSLVYTINDRYRAYIMNRTHGLLGSRFVVKIMQKPIPYNQLERQLRIYQKLAIARRVVHLLHWVAKFECYGVGGEPRGEYWVDSHALYADAQFRPVSAFTHLTHMARTWKWAETCMIFQEYDGTLEHLIGSLAPHEEWTPKQRMHLCIQVADALDEIHKRGIHHGDLHENNILYRHMASGEYKLAVADFGEAIEVGGGELPDKSNLWDMQELGQDLVYICLGKPYGNLRPISVRKMNEMQHLRDTYGQSFLDVVEACFTETLTPAEVLAGLRKIDAVLQV